MILQPLVENAIRHGIAPSSKAGRIVVASRRLNGTLQLSVRDTGAGLQAEARRHHRQPGGVGLANTRARLEQLYGPSQRFELQNGPAGGLTVLIEIPFSTEPETDEIRSCLQQPVSPV
jgi:sensor histidine kinase YesM